MRILKTIGLALFAAVLVLSTYIGCTGKIKISMPENEKPAGMIMDVEADENKPSDIKGMTVGDKVKKGLRPEDGSDTDGDGLTDKEEIEVYHSDPLKRSTAGDFMTDKEKVDRGIDVNTKEEGETPSEYLRNNTEGITFHAENADSMLAEADSCGDSFVKDGFTTIGSWTVKNYSGKMDIDVEKISEKDAGKDNLAVLIDAWPGQNLKDVKASRNGNIFTIDIKDDSEIYVVVLAERTGETHAYKSGTVQFDVMPDYGTDDLLKTAGDAAAKAAASLTGAGESLTGVGIVDSFFVFQVIGIQPEAVYVPTGNEDVDTENRAKLLRKMNDFTLGGKMHDISEVKDVSYAEYLAELAKCRSRFLGEKNHSTEPTGPDHFDIHKYLFLWCTLDDLGAAHAVVDEGSIATGNKKVGEAFDPMKDELPFRNIHTEDAPGGNCAGMSLAVVRHYLYGTSDREGAYGKYQWTISNDSENAPLLNRTVVDDLFAYKDYKFTKEHSKNGIIDESMLNPNEQQFVNMISAYQRLVNDAVHKADNAYLYDDASILDRVRSSIDSGRPVILGVSAEDGDKKMYLHAVAAFKYEKKGTDTMFYVYDCNRPTRNEAGIQQNNGCEVLHTTEYTAKDGTKRFRYYYKVFNKGAYTNTDVDSFYFNAVDGDVQVLN